jgi:hypothetical protein
MFPSDLSVLWSLAERCGAPERRPLADFVAWEEFPAFVSVKGQEEMDDGVVQRNPEAAAACDMSRLSWQVASVPFPDIAVVRRIMPLELAWSAYVRRLNRLQGLLYRGILCRWFPGYGKEAVVFSAVRETTITGPLTQATGAVSMCRLLVPGAH